MTADDRGPGSERRGVGTILAVSVLVATFGFWVWAFSPWAPRENPDRLEDREFAESAEQRCSLTLVRIAEIPSARAAETPAERADQVELATLEVEAMVTDLRGLAEGVVDQTEQDILAQWFADWDQYVADRWAHVERLRSASGDTPGRDLAFVVSAVVGTGIYTERLDGFARVNDMDSCLVPGDV
jgi:hypothetical protein